MHEMDVTRTSQMLDPALPVWGWEVPVYLFLGGLAAGVMIVSALLAARGARPSLTARLLVFSAPVLASVGMLALLFDLENPSNVHRFFLAFRPTSPMSWGAWILFAAIPVSALFGLSQLEANELPGLRALTALWRRVSPRAAALRKATLGLGIALGVYTGVLLGTLAARPLWSSALLGPLFLASGLSTGIAWLLLFRLRDDERHTLARWDRWAIVLELGLLALFLLGLATGGAPARGAAALLLGEGRFTAVFWSVVVLAGLVVPLLLARVTEGRGLRLPAVAPALVLTGGFALRWVLVAAGQ